jgi:hypothetical protein
MGPGNYFHRFLDLGNAYIVYFHAGKALSAVMIPDHQNNRYGAEKNRKFCAISKVAHKLLDTVAISIVHRKKQIFIQNIGDAGRFEKSARSYPDAGEFSCSAPIKTRSASRIFMNSLLGIFRTFQS